MTEGTQQVLIIDDEPQVVASVADLLEDDYKVVTFTDPNKAIKFMMQRPEIAVVISDQRMPQISGDQFLSQARELTKATRVLMTGYADLESVISAVNYGQIYGYLTKPWDPARFKELIDKAAEYYFLIQRLSDERDLLHALMDNMPDSIYFKDASLRFTRINQAYSELLTLTDPGQAVGKRLSELGSGGSAGKIEAEEKQILTTGKPIINNIETTGNGSSTFWFSTTKMPIKGDSGKPSGLVMVSRDVTDYHKMMLELETAREHEHYLAYHDALTDLPNRKLLYDRLEHAIALAKRHDQQLAVLFLDLDKFKSINDSLGHKYGDLLLKGVSQRLQNLMRASDSVARIGGDEFVILLEKTISSKCAVSVAQKIIRELSRPFVLDDTELTITSSIGISLYPMDAENADAMVQNADKAMYRAKNENNNSYQFYNSTEDASAFEFWVVENSLRAGMSRDELLLYYQPQVLSGTNEIVGVEALIRWNHPQHGLLAPARFISIAEESGLIVPMGEWVLETACKQARSWEQAGLGSLRMGVNLSTRQFRVMKLQENINQILKDTAFNPRNLVLEITETNAMQNMDYTIKTICGLREMGVKIAIDDFGTGYASLNYLKRFPTDILKIDRSFVLGLSAQSCDWAIINAVTNMAQQLKVKVLAEGVETRNHVDYLKTLKCDELQGYYYSRPIPPEHLTILLKEGKYLSPTGNQD